jgi:hypothetical protein
VGASLNMAPTRMHDLVGVPAGMQHSSVVCQNSSLPGGCLRAKLLDRTHLLEGKKPPYPVTGKGYQCVQQVSHAVSAPVGFCGLSIPINI